MTGLFNLMHHPKQVFWRSLIELLCTLFQKLVITPVKKELGLAFKGNQRMVVEALEVINAVIFWRVL